MPRAAGLAEELKQKFDVEAELIPGTKGIFDVKLDGEMVFSKYEADRFPNDGEVLELLNSKTGQAGN